MTTRASCSRVVVSLLVLGCGLGHVAIVKGTWATDSEVYTQKLSQSTAGYDFWTAPPSEKVFKDLPVPGAVGDEVKVYIAQNEFEPFQVVVRPSTSGSVVVGFSGFGSGISTEMYQVRYVDLTQTTDYLGRMGLNPDPLWPLDDGATVEVTANENTAFWFNVSAPVGTPPGDYLADVTIDGVNIPVRLHVFNFAIPEDVHVKSQMNFSYQTILTRYGVSGVGADYWLYLDKIKQYLIDHRLTPKSVLWPGGLTTSGAAPLIDYDCSGTFSDPYGIWGFEDPAGRYLAGSGLMDGTYAESFNQGTGFPSFMTATFQNNDASVDQRPSSFCGLVRSSGDWYTADNPNSPYNQKWFQYMGAMEGYLDGLGYLDTAYYYFANEPQDQADYDAVAWYSQQLKVAAPDLRLAVSEEPKPEIYDHPTFTGAKIDIWLAHLSIHLSPVAALERLQNHDEETWFYFLNSTYLPRFNPFTIDHPGEEAKFSGWYMWKHRLRGLAYYRFNDWGSNPWTNPLQNNQNGEAFMLYPPSEDNSNIGYGTNGHRFVPSIRLELLRDGLEDYEYFYLLSGGQPQPGVSNPADPWVERIIGGAQAFNREGEMIYNLRRLIGLKIGGEISAIPDIEPQSTHPRSDGSPEDYYINFQDPGGEPTGTVVYGGHTYMKIGSALYSAAAGYGWMRSADVPPANFYEHWDQWFDVEPTDLLRSRIIDDWGRDHVFEFDLPNGSYNVTAGVGNRGSTRTHTILIEGHTVIDNETTNNSAVIRSQLVTVKDKKLTVVMGMYDQIGYINFLDIEAVLPEIFNDGFESGDTSEWSSATP